MSPPELPIPLPGGFGRRLLPALVDEIAGSDPDRPLYSIPRTAAPADGFDDISVGVFARAVDRCAWFLHETLGGSGWDKNFPTLSYLGPQDTMYAILTLAANKTGYKMLFSSPRNTVASHLDLLDKTACDVFIMPPAFPLPSVKPILGARPMKVIEIPGQRHWYEDGQHRPYPYTKTYDEARLDPFVVLHTSGSTGHPKPIVQRHGTVTIIDSHNAFAELGLPLAFPCTDLCKGKRIYLTFPLFHTAGLSPLLAGAIYAEFTIVLAPFPPSTEIVNAVHVHGRVDQSTLAPPTIVEIARNPEYLENVSRLEYISSGGGPVPKAIGDIITTRTRLFQGMGSTECGIFPVQIPEDPADWPYIHVSPFLGQEYRPVSDDLYEQVIVRRPDLEPLQGVFATFPELDEYPMRDLYARHPTKKDLWAYRGRTDDIIVYSTGEKLNPLPMEGIINANPAVSAALVYGLGRFQSALLVEAAQPFTAEYTERDALGDIWESIEAANKTSPSFAHIHRHMVIFTAPDRPMLRAGKGTVQRKLTTDMYAAELDALYDEDNKGNAPPVKLTPGVDDDFGIDITPEVTVEDTVRAALSATTSLDSVVLDPSMDLFQLGLDSLQVTAVVRYLNRYIQVHHDTVKERISTRTVYANPTVARLASSITTLIKGSSVSLAASLTPEVRMKKIFSELTADLPISARKTSPGASESVTILLTGSTGSVGSFILASLDKNPSVARVYCLNRGTEGKKRQEESLAAKGLSLTSSDKIQYLDGDVTKARFGLSTENYTALLKDVTDVILNAWPVDFNLALESFAGHLGAVRRFIDFSSHSASGARLFFVSSISSVGGLLDNSQSLSETVPTDEDWSAPEPIGYGQSKFVAEKLLHAAAKETGVSVTICRVGQVAGPTTETGIWPRKEWLPSLVASSKRLGKLPESLGRLEVVDWVPVDVLGEVVSQLATHAPSEEASNASGAAVYHVANPAHTAWAHLLPTVVEVLGRGGQMDIVSLDAWVKALQESALEATADDLKNNPALMLLDFFEGLAGDVGKQGFLATDRAVSASKTLAASKAVSKEWLEGWLRQWGF